MPRNHFLVYINSWRKNSQVVSVKEVCRVKGILGKSRFHLREVAKDWKKQNKKMNFVEGI